MQAMKLARAVKPRHVVRCRGCGPAIALRAPKVATAAGDIGKGIQHRGASGNPTPQTGPAAAYGNTEAASYTQVRAPYGAEAIARMLGQREGLGEGFRLLDAGCGTGHLSRELAEKFPSAEVLGLDASAEMVAAAKAGSSPGNARFEVGDVLQLPYADGSFDVVVLSQVLHHLPQPLRGSISQALQEAKRVLKPGGALLVTATRWSQRRHSYWTFRLMPETVWERLAQDDRWTCFEHTEQHQETLTQVADGLGFKLNDMVIPGGSHWKPEARDNIAAALTPEWRASEGCFAYMTAAEQEEFMAEVSKTLARDQGAGLLEGVNRAREFYGEGTVYCFDKLGDETAAQFRAEATAYKEAQPAHRQQKSMTWVNLVSGKRGNLEIQPLSPFVGGVAKNVDLTDPDCLQEVRKGLWTHGALLIPASEMCFRPKGHLELAKLWGPVEEYHPINPQHREEPLVQLLPTCGKGAGPDSFLWHSDMTWRPNPSAAGLLCGHVLPPYGGDTMVVDTHAAYMRLDKDLQELLLQMTGHNDLEVGYSRVNRPRTFETNPDGYARDKSRYGGEYTADHPAVIAHYATGKPHIFINPNFTATISGAGLSEAECQEVFDRVTKELDNPEFHVAVKWQEVEAGSILIWDNLAVQHIAPADYEPHFRLMHRCVTLGPGQPRRYDASAKTDMGANLNGWGLYVKSAYAQAGFDTAASTKFYNETAEMYDQLAKPEVWLAPDIVSDLATKACKTTPPSDVKVLDFGAGTGQLGAVLKRKGFGHIDAVEPAGAMLAQAPSGVYRESYSELPDTAYDLVVSTGVIGTHVAAEAVEEELLPKVQPGGKILFSCKADTYTEQGFERLNGKMGCGASWRQDVLYGPAPLNRDMPEQLHVVVQLSREA